MQKQKTNCDFKSCLGQEGIEYTCKVKNQTIIEDSELEFIGNHENGKSNLDVIAIRFRNCKITKIPRGLIKTFPNLKILHIYESKLKNVEREDLKELCQLERLSFVLNEIAFLPDDLLADMKQLKYLSFYKNKIKMMIEPNLLDGLKKLKYVSLSSNPCIDMKFDSIMNHGNATLEEIKQAIREKYFIETSAKLKFKHGISSDINRVIQNENLKDFTIKIEGEEFKVHKFLLAARSPVLSEMIENNIDAVSLKLDNISTEIFRVILNFIYTDELPTFDNIDFANLFMAADKLKIDKLKEFAAEKLIEKINAENALEMLTFANKYDHEEMREKSFGEIKYILGYDNIDADFAKQTDLLKQSLDYKKEIDINLAKLNAIFENNP